MSQPLMISSDYHDLLSAANTAVFVTLGPDGGPHASPVWFLFDGTRVSVSTTADRQKHRNMLKNPRVAFTVFDPANPLRYVEIRGTVELSDDPDNSVRDAVARKHGFEDGAKFDSPGSRRITATINVTTVIEH
jgi:PPOX class probable F420-dependent enzyme